MRTVAALLAAALAAAPAALADPPQRTETEFSRTRVIPAGPATCPFPVQVHSEGTIRDTTFADGRFTRILSDFHITWTNLDTGTALKAVLGGPAVVEPNGDGTVTVTINGNDGNFVEPGAGPVFSQVGHIVFLAAADEPFTPLEVLQVAGRFDPALFPTVCDGLA